MSDAAFDRPDLSAFTGLDDLGLEVMGQRLGGDRTVLAYGVVGEDRWCRGCGGEGVVREAVVRRLAHVAYGWHATILHVSVGRYRCQARPRVAPELERSGRSAREALARSGAGRWWAWWSTI